MRKNEWGQTPCIYSLEANRNAYEISVFDIPGKFTLLFIIEFFKRNGKGKTKE